MIPQKHFTKHALSALNSRFGTRPDPPPRNPLHGTTTKTKFLDHVTEWPHYTQKAWHVLSGKMQFYPNNQESTH